MYALNLTQKLANKNLLILKDIYIKVEKCVWLWLWVFGIHKHKQHAYECAIDARGCLFRTIYVRNRKERMSRGIEEWEFTLRKKKKYPSNCWKYRRTHTWSAHMHICTPFRVSESCGDGGLAAYWILFSFILANFLRKKKLCESVVFGRYRCAVCRIYTTFYCCQEAIQIGKIWCGGLVGWLCTTTDA